MIVLIFLNVFIKTHHLFYSDRQTDGRRATAKTALTHSVAR